MKCQYCDTPNSRSALICCNCKRSLDPYSIDLSPPEVGGFPLDSAQSDPDIEPKRRSGGSSRGLSPDARREKSPEESDPAPQPEARPSSFRAGEGRIPADRRAIEPETPSHRHPPENSKARPDSETLRPNAGKSKEEADRWIERPSEATHPSSKARRTIEYEGVDIASLRDAERYVLQIFGKGKWHRLKSFGAKGIKIGSGERTEKFPALQTMAARHLRLTPEGSRLLVQDLGSLSGVFRRITKPKNLANGTQFRIGNYLVEFRIAQRVPEAVACSRDGERLSCADLVVPASLVFIRPSGEEGLAFPLTKTETVLGQERDDEMSYVDIHLPAEMTSRRHAKVVRSEGRYVLENLSETIGTFVRIEGADQINLYEEILAGQVKFRVVEEKD
jgi:pSer/pThr/pTyr-binding forkhead associated (FHA) protein